MIKSLFKTSRVKQVEKLDTTSVLKDFILLVLDYVDNTNKMLDEQEKETKNHPERLYIIVNNPQKDMIQNLSRFVDFCLKDIKYVEEKYIEHHKQFLRVKEMLETTDLQYEHKKLFAISSSFKEMASVEQWKGKEYKKYFNDTITFITDFDEKYFHEIIFNGHYKKELLQHIKEYMEHYGFSNYDMLSPEEFEKEMKEVSKNVRNIQINIERLVKDFS